MKLSELIPSFQPVTKNIGGRDFTIRAVSGLEQALVAAAIEKPTPPLKQDPKKPNNAPKEYDERDPAYLGQFEQWWHRTRIATVAIALEHVGASGSFPGVSDQGASVKWIREATVELECIPAGVVATIHHEVMLLSTPASPEVLDAARGN